MMPTYHISLSSNEEAQLCYILIAYSVMESIAFNEEKVNSSLKLLEKKIQKEKGNLAPEVKDRIKQLNSYYPDENNGEKTSNYHNLNANQLKTKINMFTLNELYIIRDQYSKGEYKEVFLIETIIRKFNYFAKSAESFRLHFIMSSKYVFFPKNSFIYKEGVEGITVIR